MASVSTTTPRLRLHHLFLWMAIATLVAAWQRHVTSTTAINHPSVALPTSLFDHVQTAIYVVTEATLVTVALLSIVWKVRGNVDRWEPGQWLALLATVEVVWHIFRTEVVQAIDRDHLIWWSNWFLWWDLAKSLVFASAFLFLGYIEIESRAWRIAFWILALFELFQITSCLSLIYENWNDSTFALPDWTWEAIMSSTTPALVIRHAVVAIAAALNLRGKKRFSWTHWTAIVAWLGQFVVMFW
jgi:hypothetical protein